MRGQRPEVARWFTRQFQSDGAQWTSPGGSPRPAAGASVQVGQQSRGGFTVPVEQAGHRANGLALKKSAIFDTPMSRGNAMLIVTYVTKSCPTGP